MHTAREADPQAAAPQRPRKLHTKLHGNPRNPPRKMERIQLFINPKHGFLWSKVMFKLNLVVG